MKIFFIKIRNITVVKVRKENRYVAVYCYKDHYAETLVSDSTNNLPEIDLFIFLRWKSWKWQLQSKWYRVDAFLSSLETREIYCFTLNCSLSDLMWLYNPIIRWLAGFVGFASTMPLYKFLQKLYAIVKWIKTFVLSKIIWSFKATFSIKEVTFIEIQQSSGIMILPVNICNKYALKIGTYGNKLKYENARETRNIKRYSTQWPRMAKQF